MEEKNQEKGKKHLRAMASPKMGHWETSQRRGAATQHASLRMGPDQAKLANNPFLVWYFFCQLLCGVQLRVPRTHNCHFIS